MINHADLPPPNFSPPGGPSPQFEDLPPPPRPEEMPKGERPFMYTPFIYILLVKSSLSLYTITFVTAQNLIYKG